MAKSVQWDIAPNWVEGYSAVIDGIKCHIHAFMFEDPIPKWFAQVGDIPCVVLGSKEDSILYCEQKVEELNRQVGPCANE